MRRIMEILKGTLKTRNPLMSINISQIQSISSYEDLSQVRPNYTVVVLVDGTILYTDENYPDLILRINTARNNQGPNALMPLTTTTVKVKK